jgi:polyisoprenyl-phosphate glycosyltransferase
MQKLSLVIPVYNESKNLALLHQHITAALDHLPTKLEYEIIFVDDGSSDNSWFIIQDLAAQDPQVKGISLSRNFGHQAALTAAYDHAQGDVIISMDSDLQDPPELISDMLARWRAGFDIVYARRLDRQDSALKKLTAWLYYKLLDSVADVKIPRNVGDFRLIDKKVLVVLQQCREQSRYLRGMVAWAGFRYTFVDFKRSGRHAGTTGYTWKKMFRLAFDGITSFSLFPLKLAAFIGIFIIVTGLLMLSYVFFDTFLYQVYYPLFKWLVIILYIFTGIQMLLLWLLGEYIGRIHEQQKNRPIYLINEHINMKISARQTISHASYRQIHE